MNRPPQRELDRQKDRLLLLVLDKRKRYREDDTTDGGGETGSGDAPSLVRLRWDSAEMGSPTAPLVPFLGSPSQPGTLLFRRVVRNSNFIDPSPPQGHQADGMQEGLGPSVYLRSLSYNPNYVVLDCSEANASHSYSLHDKHLFVLDDTMEAQEHPMGRLMMDVQLNNEEEECFTEPQPHSRAVVYGRGAKRKRACDVIPEYYIKPLLKTEETPSIANASPVAEAHTQGAANYWEQAESALVDEMLAELSAFPLDLHCDREEEIRKQYLEGIYCYPDHRLDDEYDSNAEDYEGNDYPDEDEDDSLSEESVSSTDDWYAADREAFYGNEHFFGSDEDDELR